MDGSNIVNLLLACAGAFSIAGAAFDWDWFMNSRRASFFVNLMGRKGARLFYVILGIIIIGISVFGFLSS